MGKKRTPEQVERMREAQRVARERRAQEREAVAELEDAGAAALDVAVGQDFNPIFAPTIGVDVLDALESTMWANALPRGDHRRRPGGCLRCEDPRGLKPCPCQDGWAVLKRYGRVHAGSIR